MTSSAIRNSNSKINGVTASIRDTSFFEISFGAMFVHLLSEDNEHWDIIVRRDGQQSPLEVLENVTECEALEVISSL